MDFKLQLKYCLYLGNNYILGVEGQNLELPDPKNGKCTICGKQFSNYHNARRHMREQHETRLECKFCGVTKSRKSYLMQHIAKFHSSSEFE